MRSDAQRAAIEHTYAIAQLNPRLSYSLQVASIEGESLFGHIGVTI
jgi:hypothetical protein